MGYPQKIKVYKYKGPSFVTPTGKQINHGDTYHLRDWATYTGIKHSTLYARMSKNKGRLTQQVFDNWINPKYKAKGYDPLVPGISQKYVRYIKKRNAAIRELLACGTPVSKIYKQLHVSSVTVTEIIKKLKKKTEFNTNEDFAPKKREVRCKCPYCKKVYYLKTDEYTGNGVWYRYCTQGTCLGASKASRTQARESSHTEFANQNFN